MATTYRLVLVGPSWAASTANGTPDLWVPDHDEAVVTLVDPGQEVKIEDDSPAERARKLLEELEQQGASLEASFKDDSCYLPDLSVFPEMGKPAEEPALPMDLEDTEALLMDLATLLPKVEDSPPHSPAPFPELEELLQLRAQEVLMDETVLDEQQLVDLLPLTPADSSVSSPGPQSSPSYAPSTPASIYSDSSNDPEWVPEEWSAKAKTAPARERRKPYSRVKHPADRAERKKLQNKNAATRYRNKKKVEEEDLLDQEAVLLEKNRELKEKVKEAETEMRIVKDLLRNKFRRMGLLK